MFGSTVATAEVVLVMSVPLQLYEYGVEPPETFAVKLSCALLPEHHSVVPLDEILTTGPVGITCIATEDVAVQPPASVTVTV